jgi:hypothetical protein
MLAGAAFFLNMAARKQAATGLIRMTVVVLWPRTSIVVVQDITRTRTLYETIRVATASPVDRDVENLTTGIVRRAESAIAGIRREGDRGPATGVKRRGRPNVGVSPEPDGVAIAGTETQRARQRVMGCKRL